MSPFPRLVLATLAVAGCVRHHIDPDATRHNCPDGAVSPMATDSVLLDAAAAVVRIGPRLRSAWPGFWSGEEPFILTVPGQAAVVVRRYDAPDRFDPVCGPGVPQAIRGKVYIHRGVLPDLMASRGYFDLAYPLGTSTATAVPIADSTEATVALLFHEAFHAFQDRTFPPPSRDEAAAPEVYSDSAFTKLAELERRLLAAALDEHADRRSRLLTAYLAVRAQREEQMADIAILTGRELEAVEGTAELVGTYAATFVAAEPADGVAARVQEMLLNPLDRALDDWWRHRMRLYGTGAALGLLLDQMKVEWRARVQEGEYLDQQLASALGSPSILFSRPSGSPLRLR